MISESIENLKSKIQNFGRLPFPPVFGGHRRGRLLRRYFLTSVLMIAGGLITSGILETYFRIKKAESSLLSYSKKSQMSPL